VLLVVERINCWEKNFCYTYVNCVMCQRPKCTHTQVVLFVYSDQLTIDSQLLLYSVYPSRQCWTIHNYTCPCSWLDRLGSGDLEKSPQCFWHHPHKKKRFSRKLSSKRDMNEGPRRWCVYHQVNRHIGHKRVCSNKTDLVLYKRLAEKVGCHYREGTSFIRARHAQCTHSHQYCTSIIISIKKMIKAWVEHG
jgi:hypothetical protein